MADGTAAAPSAAPTGVPGATPPTGQQANATAKPGETSAQTQARMLKLMLDGAEVELPESEVVANLKKGKNAAQLLSKVEQRRQEALKARAEADGILSRLKGDPRGVLRELGVDLRGLSEQTILDEIKLEQMTPAERRAHELEQKLKALESEKEQAKKSEEAKAHEAEVARHKDEFAHLFVTTFEGLGLPKSSARYVVGRMASLYQQNEAAGLESTPEEMASHVMEGLKREHTGVLSGLEGDGLLEYLGPDVVKKVLGAHLAKVRARNRSTAQPSQQRQSTLPQVESPDPRKGRWNAIEALIKQQ